MYAPNVCRCYVTLSRVDVFQIGKGTICTRDLSIYGNACPVILAARSIRELGCHAVFLSLGWWTWVGRGQSAGSGFTASRM